MTAVSSRRLDLRPALVVMAAVLAVISLTVAVGAILSDEPTVREALIAVIAGLGAIAVADRRREGGDIIRLFGAAGAMLAVPIALLALAPSVGAGVERLAGADRTATALAVSQHVYDTAETVVIVDATSAPDAVAAAPLASKVQGPLLLSGDGVAEEVQRLEASRVLLVGGVAQDEALGEQLREAGVRSVISVAGTDRYATSAAVAARIRPDRVYVTSGWADGIAVSPLTSDGGAVLTVPSNGVPPATIDALRRINPSEVVVVGGDAAVTPNVQDFLTALLPQAEVTRLAGEDRWATSLAVFEESGHSGEYLWVASGTSWPDALAAAVGAAAEDRPMLLVPSRGSAPSTDTVRWLASNRRDIEGITVVGGSEAVPPKLLDGVRAR